MRVECKIMENKIDIFRVGRHVAFRGDIEQLSKGDFRNLENLFLALEFNEKMKLKLLTEN